MRERRGWAGVGRGEEGVGRGEEGVGRGEEGVRREWGCGRYNSDDFKN